MQGASESKAACFLSEITQQLQAFHSNWSPAAPKAHQALLWATWGQVFMNLGVLLLSSHENEIILHPLSRSGFVSACWPWPLSAVGSFDPSCFVGKRHLLANLFFFSSFYFSSMITVSASQNLNEVRSALVIKYRATFLLLIQMWSEEGRQQDLHSANELTLTYSCFTHFFYSGLRKKGDLFANELL